MHWSVLPRTERIKSSTYFTLSKLAWTGVSAYNFSSMSPSGIYSSKILLAYAAISSERTHLLSSSLVTIQKQFIGVSLVSFSSSELWDPYPDSISDDGVGKPLLFLYFLLFSSCLEAGSFELTSALSVLPITGSAWWVLLPVVVSADVYAKDTVHRLSLEFVCTGFSSIIIDIFDDYCF